MVGEPKGTHSTTIWADQPTRMKGGLSYTLDGQPNSVSSAWYRGDDCNYLPKLNQLRHAQSAEKYILQGWAPEEPRIAPTDKIVAFGSCFANHISRWLNDREFTVTTSDSTSNAYVVQFSDAMVTTFSILQQFEWALENVEFTQNLWHGKDKRRQSYDEEVKEKTKELFLSADVFIITLGLSEIWYDEPTGEVFWRAVPLDEVNAERHKFRVSSVAENKQNIVKTCQLIRKYRPSATIIFTLSPVPLAATFRDESCLCANSVSKAVLRSAIDEAYRELEPGTFHYWPSYELALNLFDNAFRSDARHLKNEVVEYIMMLFEHTWCRCSRNKPELLHYFVRARLATGSLPKNLWNAFRANDDKRLDEVIRAIKQRSEDDAKLVSEWREIANEFYAEG